MKKLTVLLSAFILSVGINSYAQTAAYSLTDQSTMTIEGTSTLHDWECSVDDISARAQINNEAAAGESLVEQFKFVAQVESIECGKGAMNRKTYGALKEDDHPTISFTLTDATLKSNPDEQQTVELNVEGDLTIAGVTKSVSFPAEGKMLDNNQYQFNGTYRLNMRDYNVDPPSAVLGTIRAGEEVEVAFSVILAR